MIDNLIFLPRTRECSALTSPPQLSGRALTLEFDDPFKFASWQIQNSGHGVAEKIMCSPVMSTNELTRIRNNVVATYNFLRSNFSNVGNTLDSTGLVESYSRVFDAMEGGNYCYYQSDQRLVDDIQNSATGANQVLQSGFSQFAQSFSVHLQPLRTALQDLRNNVNSATTSVEPVINSYERLWNSNFDFHLHQGVNSSLDSMMSEYSQIMQNSNLLLEQGTSRVQNFFEADVRQSNIVFAGFAKAFDYWNNQDGATGYGMYVDNIRMYQEALQKLNQYTVLDTPRNKQIFSEIDMHIEELKKQFAEFPTFVQAMATTGFQLDPGTSALKFYSRQAVLNLAQAAGQYYTTEIAPGKSLIGTGFSYKHGGKMPPHAEHKDGKDCDIFSEYFKVGTAAYDEERAKKMAVFLLRNNITRLIYTNSAVVNYANGAVPGNAVATTGTGHETHMHFDLETATILNT